MTTQICNNHKKCYEHCNYKKQCNLTLKYHEKHREVEKEINYTLRKIAKNNENIKLYFEIKNEIKEGKYQGQKNCLNETIHEPEHIVQGLNINILNEKHEFLLEELRLSRKQELNIHRILKKAKTK